MDTALHQARGDERGRAADAPCGVHAQHRFADGTERIGEIALGHHHALEEVGRFPDHDGVYVFPRHFGVDERTLRGFANEPRHRDVLADRVVLRLADPDHRDAPLGHLRHPPGRRRDSAAGNAPTSRAPARDHSRRAGSSPPPPRYGSTRPPSWGWPRAARPTD